MKHIISLGAGVQSSTMALMAAHGEITPMPDAAIFADTGWESSEVYEWLDWLKKQLPFPMLRVQREGRDLGEFSKAVASGELPRKGASIPPWYLDQPFGMLLLRCSKEFKTRVVHLQLRTMLGLERGERGPKEQAFSQWLGISKDEAHRQKDSELKNVKNRYPLIELDMTRGGCLNWMEAKGYPTPPRSSCIFCPYRSDKERVHLRDSLPDDWNKAVQFDAAIRAGYEGMEGGAFVHTSRVPLDQVNFRHDGQPNMFGNECEGMCGV